MQSSVTSLAWDDENVEHIARHRVSPAEVEQVCFAAEKVVLRAERAGRYVILGRTEAGRYLTVVVTTPRQGRVRVITARDMSDRERRRYAQLKGRS
ncbi:BrnT family toxin [Candidatus Acetothermia bacterium]|nr:BrnT family toxin [Candidatus Acetothermia bacterium]